MNGHDNPPPSVILPADQFRTYLQTLFEAMGAPADIAAIVVDQLVQSSLDGHDSHGSLRAPWYMEKIEAGEIIPAARPEIVLDGPATAVIDGGWGFGQTASCMAMETAIAKAVLYGVATVCVRNANHMGRVGYYTAMAARQGMIGMGGVSLHGGSPCVAPFGGIDRRLSTNPVSVAYPTGRNPDFLADLTTCAVPEGKVQVRRNRGEATPEGWLIDHDGHSTTDPWTFYNDPLGSILPLGGVVSHKGYALAMAVEGLAGGLSGAPLAGPDPVRHGNACWYTATRIESFLPLAEFTAKIGGMIDYVKSSRKAEGVNEILYPGEPEWRARQQRLANGIPVDGVTWAWLARYAAKTGVTPPV
ncbi:MAG: Ldh family oxidoreductase [Rhodospirillaceae bacterium]|nr:Ldh family oxidoreductase [Rhodospirillaceae bacterium]